MVEVPSRRREMFLKEMGEEEIRTGWRRREERVRGRLRARSEEGSSILGAGAEEEVERMGTEVERRRKRLRWVGGDGRRCWMGGRCC